MCTTLYITHYTCALLTVYTDQFTLLNTKYIVWTIELDITTHYTLYWREKVELKLQSG